MRALGQTDGRGKTCLGAWALACRVLAGTPHRTVDRGSTLRTTTRQRSFAAFFVLISATIMA